MLATLLQSARTALNSVLCTHWNFMLPLAVAAVLDVTEYLEYAWHLFAICLAGGQARQGCTPVMNCLLVPIV